MNKWTPGPWAVDAELIRGANLAIVASTWSGIRGDASDATPSDRARAMEANARLIAAAPEMAEVLEAITKRMEWDYTEGPCVDQSVGAALPPELYAARAILARINEESQ